jgi:hypothetical protein
LNQLSPSPKKKQIGTPVVDLPLDGNSASHKNTDESELNQSNDGLMADGSSEHLEDKVRNTSVSNKKNKKKKSNSRIADSGGKEKISAITGGPDRDVGELFPVTVVILCKDSRMAIF